MYIHVFLLFAYSGAQRREHKNALRTRSARTGEWVSLHVHIQAYTLTAQYVANILAAFFPFK